MAAATPRRARTTTPKAPAPARTKAGRSSKVGTDAATRTAALLGQGAQLVQAVPGQMELPGTGQGAGSGAAPDVPAAGAGLDPEAVRDALRRAPHRPEDGNAKLTTDLPAQLRADLAAYRAWHGFSERALLALLVSRLLAGDPDGGWRQGAGA